MQQQLKAQLKARYKDPFGRFGRCDFILPPPHCCPFLLHIAALTGNAIVGIVCPHSFLSHRWPEWLESQYIDAIVALPWGAFYGDEIPASLLILNYERPPERNGKVLFVHAARHYRELSNQNELRPEDVMRILVHYHAYGDPGEVAAIVSEHSGRIREQIFVREAEEVAWLEALYKEHNARFAKLDTEIARLEAEIERTTKGEDRVKVETKIGKFDSRREKHAAKIRMRDKRIAGVRRRAEEDRKALADVGRELAKLYGDSDELKNARVVSIHGLQEKDFKLHMPVEPEHSVEIKDPPTSTATPVQDREIPEFDQILPSLEKAAELFEKSGPRAEWHFHSQVTYNT